MKPWEEAKRVAEAWEPWGNVNREPCFECLQDKILESLILKVHQTQILCKQNSFCRTGIVVVLKDLVWTQAPWGLLPGARAWGDWDGGEVPLLWRPKGQVERSFAPSFWHLANSQPQVTSTNSGNESPIRSPWQRCGFRLVVFFIRPQINGQANKQNKKTQLKS